MKFHVTSKWVDSRSSASYCKNAEHSLDTTLDGNQKAFNPAEPLLGALSACMIKGILRAAPILDFRLTGIEVVVSGVRQETRRAVDRRTL